MTRAWVIVGVAAAVAGAIALGPVFAVSGVSSSATATEAAVRGATQTQVNPPPPPPAPTARYLVVLDVTFDSSSHPGTAPPNAHVSPPVLAAHRSPGAVFAVGRLATLGIETMAELGRTDILVPELGADATVTQVQVAAGVTGSGTREFTVELTPTADLVSVVTMLAPSPDWFIGFADADLFVDGAWVDLLQFPVGSYDAGTDSGSAFTSSNVDTRPSQPVAGPRDAVFTAAAAQHGFASVTITRIG